MAEKIDWIEAKKEYISDNSTSFKSIGEKYGVSRKTVQERGTREGWLAERQRVAEEAVQRASERLIDQKAKINSRHSQTYMNMQALLLKQLNSYIEFTDATLTKAKEDGRVLNPRELEISQRIMFLTNGLKTAIDGERVAEGLPTSYIKNDSDVKFSTDLSELSDEELEKIRKAGENANSDKDGDT